MTYCISINLDDAIRHRGDAYRHSVGLMMTLR